MKNHIIRRYQQENKAIWNTFISNAKNATFLFNRDFMDYHSDRFEDFSLLIFDESEKLIAVLPANRLGDTVYSHQGLSYGGLVLHSKIKLEEVIYMVKEMLTFLKENDIKKLHLKLLPIIYFKKPSHEIDYILFLIEAKLTRRDSSTVIELNHSINYSQLRNRGIKKAIANKLVIKEENNFDLFWNTILTPNLEKTYNTKPVHTLQEITLLKEKFPKNIRQFNVYHNNIIVGGTTIFETETVAHAQYISANATRAELGSLDFLFDHLIKNVFHKKRFFDFGISNEDYGKKLNAGLSYWKESFGANTIVHDFYEVDTEKYTLLNNVII